MNNKEFYDVVVIERVELLTRLLVDSGEERDREIAIAWIHEMCFVLKENTVNSVY